MYQLQKETEKKRIYRSSVTGTDMTTTLIYTDIEGRKWWGFEDLLQIPHIRRMAANNISQLYGVGFTQKDLSDFVSRSKNILKGNDSDKYEKAYSELLQLEAIAESNIDPVKQELGLCAVYVLGDSERVDFFSSSEASEKMELWSMDIDAQAFFLSWLSDGITGYSQVSSSIGQTVSQVKKLLARKESTSN